MNIFQVQDFPFQGFHFLLLLSDRLTNIGLCVLVQDVLCSLVSLR